MNAPRATWVGRHITAVHGYRTGIATDGTLSRYLDVTFNDGTDLDHINVGSIAITTNHDDAHCGPGTCPFSACAGCPWAGWHA